MPPDSKADAIESHNSSNLVCSGIRITHRLHVALRPENPLRDQGHRDILWAQ